LQNAVLYDDGQHRDYLAGDGYYGAFAGVAMADTLFYFIEHTDPTGRTGREPRNGWNMVVTTGIPFLKINEWMAGNATTIADEAGEFDDWIEVYNPLSNDQKLSRICISDSLTNLGKWQLPDTTISGQGFFLLWADENKRQGPFHMSFKLSATTGEELYVSYFNGERYRIIDSVSFGSMSPDHSIGCIPDGIRPMVFQQPPSPGSSNLTNRIAPVNPNDRLMLYPNPASTSVYLQGVPDGSNVEIRALTGQRCLSVPVTGEKIDIGILTEGIYLILVETSDGKRLHARLSVVGRD